MLPVHTILHPTALGTAPDPALDLACALASAHRAAPGSRHGAVRRGRLSLSWEPSMRAALVVPASLALATCAAVWLAMLDRAPGQSSPPEPAVSEPRRSEPSQVGTGSATPLV